jgi:thioredoxin 1
MQWRSLRRQPIEPASPGPAPQYFETIFRSDFVSDAVLDVKDSEFENQVLKSSEPVLVDFWAEWCGPCKMIGPMVEELALVYTGKMKVVKLNIEKNPTTPRQYAVRNIPTLMLFKDGKVHSTQVGAVARTQLVQFIERGIA